MPSASAEGSRGHGLDLTHQEGIYIRSRGSLRIPGLAGAPVAPPSAAHRSASSSLARTIEALWKLLDEWILVLRMLITESR